MSADNWGLCPKCTKEVLQKEGERIKELHESYGKVDEATYKKMLTESKEPIKQEETLREDYEMWIDDGGLFYISYSAMCTKCGFKHSFNHREQLTLE